MINTNHWKTIVISDIHLGTKNSRAREVVEFLKANSCERLILNGDIIDGWQLKKSGKWKKRHTNFFKTILDMASGKNTEVIYIRGNHDDFMDNIIPFRFGNISLRREYLLYSGDKKFYVIHGDIFDTITTNFRWLARLGDIGYTMLLWVNKVYNNRRLRSGLPYHSLSKMIKYKVKSAVSYISGFEGELSKIAKIKNCDGVICGHIHTPSISIHDGIIYMNSGDWVESLSALVEDYFGNWKILYYNDIKSDGEGLNGNKESFGEQNMNEQVVVNKEQYALH